MSSNKNKKETPVMAIYEINDEGRQSEYNGQLYVAAFVDFIRSMGFDVQHSYPGSESIKIDDIEFYIHTDNASYMSKNPFRSREERRAIRKPQNRFLAIKRTYGSDSYVCKVFFNTEFDLNKIKEKIQGAIEERIKRNNEIEAGKQADKDNTIAIANHYLSQSGIKSFVSSILIEHSEIRFYIDNCGSITVSADTNKVIGIHIGIKDVEEVKSDQDFIDKSTAMYSHLSAAKPKFIRIVDCITVAGPITNNLKEWSKKAYHRYFDVKKMKYSEF